MKKMFRVLVLKEYMYQDNLFQRISMIYQNLIIHVLRKQFVDYGQI